MIENSNLLPVLLISLSHFVLGTIAYKCEDVDETMTDVALFFNSLLFSAFEVSWRVKMCVCVCALKEQWFWTELKNKYNNILRCISILATNIQIFECYATYLHIHWHARYTSVFPATKQTHWAIELMW